MEKISLSPIEVKQIEGRTHDDRISRLEHFLVSKLDDGKHIHYLDIGEAFLEDDQTLPRSIMPDLLHLSPQGYEIWAKSIETKLASLLSK